MSHHEYDVMICFFFSETETHIQAYDLALTILANYILSKIFVLEVTKLVIRVKISISDYLENVTHAKNPELYWPGK